MNLESEYIFRDIPVQRWFSILLDPAFDDFIEKRLDLQERKVLESKDNGRVITRRIRMVPVIPRAFGKFVQRGIFQVEEKSEIVIEKGLIEWRVEPSLGGDRFDGHGSVRVFSHGQGCKRILKGEIRLDVPLLGSRLEGKIVDLILDSYNRASRLMEEWHRKTGQH
ncbi:MAG: DUF2505 family protein [Deltaproteobacteria bacterium]|nr:DUF2505 family protein [Deltaproteobacteria bacterium]